MLSWVNYNLLHQVKKQLWTTLIAQDVCFQTSHMNFATTNMNDETRAIPTSVKTKRRSRTEQTGKQHHFGTSHSLFSAYTTDERLSSRPRETLTSIITKISVYKSGRNRSVQFSIFTCLPMAVGHFTSWMLGMPKMSNCKTTVCRFHPLHRFYQTVGRILFTQTVLSYWTATPLSFCLSWLCLT